MQSPFPGMDPYLEHPAFWPDVHNRLIAAIADALSPLVAPRYYVALERRTYLLKADDLVLIGRPDVAVVSGSVPSIRTEAVQAQEVAVLDVEVPMHDEVGETYLEIHDASTGTLVTILELLSPANKLHAEGRAAFEKKREQTFATRTNWIEVDLLRAGEHMMVVGHAVQSDYRILVSRGQDRPKARLIAFGLRQPIPDFQVPLFPKEPEPVVRLNTLLHELYERARFDLRIDYSKPPVPPLAGADRDWARQIIGKAP